MKKKWLGIVIGVILSAVQTMPVSAEQATVRIGTAAELRAFARQVNGGDYGASAVLTADIDLGGEVWTPIGGQYATESYQGIFDGNGYSISGLLVTGTESYRGIFTYVSGMVRNVTVYGRIEGASYLGGIAGYLAGGQIQNCANHTEITGIKTMIGGIVGYNNKGTVEGCYNMGAVTGDSSVGGIVGGEQTRTAGTILNCYNMGKITATSNFAGGIFGQPKKGTVQNCYNTGIVSSPTNCGSITGFLSSSTITNCYYLDASAAQGVGNIALDAASTVRKTAAEMHAKEFAAILGMGFDVDTDGQNSGFPILIWQKKGSGGITVTYEQGAIRAEAPVGTEAAVYAAAYQGNILRSTYKAELISGIAEIQDSALKLTGADTIRVFVWRDGMTPVSDTAHFIITE